MAARLEKLGIAVEQAEGHYGEFTVLVDGEPASRGGALAFLGVLPRVRSVVDAVRMKLAR